jgi:enoyl-CoA hydratase/carnithine racemase
MADHPPPTTFALLSHPSPHILLITYNNPRSLNCMSSTANAELHSILEWYDASPHLRCCIVTGAGRAFSAGADLKEWNNSNNATASGTAVRQRTMAPSGFAGLSRRTGRKPVIAAVNGVAFGGGMEAVVNTDIVVASQSARFGLPEVKRGVVALAGALPRLIRTVGKQRAMEMALTGEPISAEKAREWGIVNYVVPDHKEDAEVMERPVVKKALELAGLIVGNSPDSVVVSRAGVLAGWEEGSAENATRTQLEIWGRRLNEGENIREGVKAFVEKRAPRWVPSKL